MFLEEFSEPPLEDMIPLQYFSMFIITVLLDIVVKQTNIYSCQTTYESIDTNHAEVISLTGMSIKMGYYNYHPINCTGAKNFVVQE